MGEPRCRELAKVLWNEHHVNRNDVVHILLPNCTQYHLIALAVWRLQGVVSPADPCLSSAVLAAQLDDAQTKVIFCCSQTLNTVMAARESLKKDIPVVVIDIEEDIDDSVKSLTKLTSLASDELPVSSVVEKNERTLICWSSGTTGRPKGIQHGSTMWLKTLVESPAPYRILQTTCMFHLGGFFNPISSLIRGGSTVFLAEADLEGDIAIIIKAAEMTSAVSLTCGTHHAVKLVHRNMKDLTPCESMLMVWPLGATMYDGILEDLKRKFPKLMFVGNVYGQSEIFTPVAISFSQTYVGGLNGLNGGIDALKFVDPDTKAIVGPHKVGEFAVKVTEGAMIGYLNNEEANKKFFGVDSFLYLGDLGHYDEDGLIYYDGRLKELIKYKNIHIYPSEIEDLLIKLPGILDVAVFGREDPSVQELVTAVVVKADGVDISKEAIEQHFSDHLDDHKQLRGGVQFVKEIPRNPQGQILRRNLLKMIL